MSDIQEFKSILSSVVSIVNSKPEAKGIVNRWIDDKYGKIIGWKIRSGEKEENYHLIFTAQEARFNIGEYPAFDTMIIGNLETLLGLIKGEKRLNDELKQASIMVWGNLNEGLGFERVLGKIKSIGGN